MQPSPTTPGAPARTSLQTAAFLLAPIAAATAAGTLAYATTSPASQIFGPLLPVPPRPTDIALTFDDGPNPTATPHLLDLLAKHNLRATFFLIGRYTLSQPTLARQIAAAGHTFGNHTHTHPRLPLCTHRRILAELRDAQHAIEDTTGAPVRLFRPPHGYRTPFVLHTARDLGLTPTTWNIIGHDWSLPTPESITDRILAGIARNQRRGLASNIVLHDGSQTTPTADRRRTLAATSALLDHLRPQNPRFVPLADWL